MGGKAYYIPKDFYVRAESGSEAADRVRQFGRVKHHHKDAILGTERISYEDYLLGQERNRQDPYFFCNSFQEQQQYWDQIGPLVQMDPHCLEEANHRKPKPDYAYRTKKNSCRMNSYDDYAE